MLLKDAILQAQNNIADLEQHYRQAVTDGETHAFTEAIEHAIAEQPQNTLLLAWAYRLDILPKDDSTKAHTTQHTHWPKAIGISIVLGFLFLLLSGNHPPVPAPELKHPYFWLGWSPFLALAIFTFFLNPTNKQQILIWGAVIVIISSLTALIFWNRTDHIAELAALHFPLVIWAIIGGCVIHKHNNPATQFHAYSVKSVETILTGGIFFGAFMIFLMLTYGIFQVMDIKIADHHMQKAIAWGIGAISILALASVYDPSTSPTAQNWTSGLTRLLGILTRLLLPLTLAVLTIYIFYFIPAYFWRPFEEREVLIIYNATILAILVLVALAIAYTHDQTQQTLLRHALHVLSFLTGLLNLYALSAIIYRITTYGLTPNRYMVLGWNIITLIMLVVVVITLWRAQPNTWAIKLRESLARTSVFAIAWALWVLFILPLSFL